MVDRRFGRPGRRFRLGASAARAVSRITRTTDRPSRVLDDDVPDHVRGRLARVEGGLERVEDVLPADDDERVDAGIAEEVGNRLADDAVARVLEPLQLDQLGLDALHPAQLAERPVEALDRPDDDRALLERLPRGRLDAVELEQVAG